MCYLWAIGPFANAGFTTTTQYFSQQVPDGKTFLEGMNVTHRQVPTHDGDMITHKILFVALTQRMDFSKKCRAA